MEAARSDAPDAFQGLFAALEEACRGKRLSVDQRRGNQRRADGVGADAIDHTQVDAGNFAVVSRSFAAAREVGACADDAAPFRGAAPADVSEACLRSLDAHAATERLGALDDFAVYAASDVIDRADADELLRLAEDQWTASAAAGDATNNYRTSETASLRDDASRASKAVDRVAARAAALFGLPRSGSRVVPVSSPVRHRREGRRDNATHSERRGDGVEKATTRKDHDKNTGRAARRCSSCGTRRRPRSTSRTSTASRRRARFC